jgi:hypothetical protein
VITEIDLPVPISSIDVDEQSRLDVVAFSPRAQADPYILQTIAAVLHVMIQSDLAFLLFSAFFLFSAADSVEDLRGRARFRSASFGFIFRHKEM